MSESGLEMSIRWILNLPQSEPGACNTPEIHAHIDTLVSMGPKYAEKCLDEIYESYVAYVGGFSTKTYVSTIENLLGMLANAPHLAGHSKAAKQIISLKQDEYGHHCVDKALELFDKYDADLAEKLLVRFECFRDGICDALDYLANENTEDMLGVDFKNQIRATHNCLVKLHSVLMWGVGATPCFLLDTYNISRAEANNIEMRSKAKAAKKINYNFTKESPIGYLIRTAIKANPSTKTLKHRLKWEKAKKFLASIKDEQTYSPEERAPIYAWFMSNCCADKLVF